MHKMPYWVPITILYEVFMSLILMLQNNLRNLVKSIVYQWSFQNKHFGLMVLINRSSRIFYHLSECIPNYIRFSIHFTYEYLIEVSCSSLW